MSNTSSNFEMAGVLLGKEVRKRKTPQEKIAIIQQTMEPGMTVSHVARLHGIQPSLLFKWKKQYQEGSLTAVAAGKDVVPASKLAVAIKQINQLQRLLGKKTMEEYLQNPLHAVMPERGFWLIPSPGSMQTICRYTASQKERHLPANQKIQKQSSHFVKQHAIFCKSLVEILLTDAAPAAWKAARCGYM